MKICEHFTNVEQDCFCKMKQKVLGTIESYDGEECGKCPNRTTRTIEPLDGKFWLPDVYKKSGIGGGWLCPTKSCVFCCNCTDIIWDSHGPYMVICEFEGGNEHITEKGVCGKCELFKEDKSNA